MDAVRSNADDEMWVKLSACNIYDAKTKKVRGLLVLGAWAA